VGPQLGFTTISVGCENQITRERRMYMKPKKIGGKERREQKKAQSKLKHFTGLKN
jgi:hypothetical protein